MRLLSTSILSLAVLLAGCTGHRVRDARTAAAIFTTFAIVASVASEASAVGECSDDERQVDHVDHVDADGYVETTCRCSVTQR